MHRINTIKCYKSTQLGYALILETSSIQKAQQWLKRQTKGFVQFPMQIID